jgi:serine phosphatase RsbU (regulator of sigma subunit)
MICVFASSSSFAQLNVDSLKISFDYAETAEERFETQQLIAEYYYDTRSLDTAIFEYIKAIDMVPAEQLELKADLVTRVAKIYRHREEVSNQIIYYKAATELYVKANSAPEIVAKSYSHLGRSYYDEAQYDTAMVYYMDAKKVYEENKVVNEDYGNLLHFIGSVFKRQDNYDKACEYYQMEIDYGKKHGFKGIEVEGMYLSGICIEGDTARLRNDQKCLEIYQEIGSETAIALMYSLIAGGYKSIEMYDSALYYQMKSLEIYRQGTKKSHLASLLADISRSYMRKRDFTTARKYLEEAEETARQSELKLFIRLEDIYGAYYELNYKQGKYKDAAEYLQLMYVYRDSARDTEHADAIQEMELVYNTEKQEAENALLKKDKAIANKEKKIAEDEAATQSFITLLFMIGGGLLLIAGVFTFIKYRESQKQKQVITEQKKEMQFQKELVEEKNKDIIDSMVYASSIQRAIITSEEYIANMFNDFFVFYKPRDIVSGDFYWAYKTECGKRLIAVGDCTGHGVPGAMMSMLGTAFLNEIVIEGKEYHPPAILNKLRDHVKNSLQGNASKDGMDMSFCCIEDEKLTYSGANLPLYVLRAGELIEIKGNKQPIGYQPAGEVPFNEKLLDLERDDKLYLFSDGYADQFGGPKGKKYKYKTFRDKLSAISTMTFGQQRKIIDEEFEIWKGDLEQLDDVCVIGIKV